MKRNKVFTIKSPLVNLIGKTSYAYLKVKVSNIAMQGCYFILRYAIRIYSNRLLLHIAR